MKAEHQPNPTILLLGSFPPQAQGIPGYCGGLARALAARGPVHAIGFKAMYPVFLFPGVSTSMDPTSPAPEVRNLTVNHPLAWYNPFAWLWHAIATPDDIVHVQWWSLPLFPVCLTFVLAAKLRRLPLVITVHNVLPHESSPWFLRASRMLYHFADHLVVHSDVNRAQLLQRFGIPRERVSCVPMGIDQHHGQRIEKEHARVSLAIPLDRPTLLFFGTIRAYKGLDVLLRALAMVRKDYPDVQLIIAGKPWEAWERYSAIIESERLEEHVITRLDYIPESEVSLLYAAADLVVLPYTHFDAQSAVGVQTLSHGRPMIVTECGGLPALANEEKRWIALPDDPLSLSVKVDDFLKDPSRASEDFAAITRRVSEDMSWEAVAEAHWGIYGQLMG